MTPRRVLVPVSEFTRFHLPGLNLPLNWVPHEDYIDIEEEPRIKVPAQGEGNDLFPSALDTADNDALNLCLPLTTVREFTMLQIMDSITDKPGWEEKIFNDRTAEEWKAEAIENPDHDVSKAMMNWVIDELRFKAKDFKITGAVSVYEADVVKSDIAISTATKLALQKAIRKLEDVPAVYKDWHPGSDEKVLDLVHPSLFPLIYGRSRVLLDTLVPLDDCIEYCGRGKVVNVRLPHELKALRNGRLDYREGLKRYEHGSQPYSKHFQWLPCDIEFVANDKVKVTSYINNLHPQTYAHLYSVIEDVIAGALPLWNKTLTPLKNGRIQPINRITYTKVEYDPDPGSWDDGDRPRQLNGEEIDDYWDRLSYWERSIRVVKQPEPGEFKPPKALTEEQKVDLRRDYGHRGLQVIVKFANIQLSPDKPEYKGGSWRAEGQLNEHICASALYYYDSENITSSRLFFRQQSDTVAAELGVSYPQDDHDFLPAVFGLDPRSPPVQEVGSVACIEGRLLTFPNILQHRVQPFKLADPTKKGHQKILALYLVDPGIRIISTANVPPQQKDWWSGAILRDFAGTEKKFGVLSPELRELVFQAVDDFPIGMTEAKEIRLRLLKEQRTYAVKQEKAFQQHEFCLYGH